MLKKIKRCTHQMGLFIEYLAQDENLTYVECPNPKKLCYDLLQILEQYPINLVASSNPSYTNYFRVDLSTLLPSELKDIVSIALVYSGLGRNTGTPDEDVWIPFVATTCAALGAQPIITSHSGPSASSKQLYLATNSASSSYVQQTLIDLLKKLGLEDSIILRIKPCSDVVQELKEKLSATQLFYEETEAEWTQSFYENLGDDLSRQSLSTFILQRMWAQTFWDTDVYYTMTPPIQSASWRKERLKSPPPLPTIVAPDMEMIPFFNLHTFIWEQYAIPGLVEAKRDDIVMDVGAGFGDTAIYFSQKIKNTGTIYAFEPLPANIQMLHQNATANQCDNITIVPLALADTDKVINFGVFESGTTTTCGELSPSSKALDSILVQATTLDSFVQKENTTVDFLKADIEGAELEMLIGAKNTLTSRTPTCALALYHRQEDYRALPQFLMECSADYTFYIRCDAEPTLFAVNHDKP